MGQRAHLRLRVEPRADAQRRRGPCKARGPVVEVAPMHVEADRRRAHLARVAVLGKHRALEREAEVGVFADDHRRMPAQLRRVALHALRGQHAELLAHRDRAGERHLAYRLMADEKRRHPRRVSAHEVDGVRRHAGVEQRLHQRNAGARRFFRGLDDHAAAGGQCAAQLACRQVHRKVPRRERGHRPHRLARHGLAQDAGHARRHGAAVEPLGLLRLEVDDVGRQHDLAQRFGQRLALFQRERSRNRRCALAQQFGGAA